MEKEDSEIVKQRLKEAFSGYYEIAGGKEFRYHHHISVHKYAIQLREREEIAEEFDMQVVELAALFHDVGRAEDIEDGVMSPFEGHEGHAERGAEIVEEYIGDKIDEETLEQVETIIRNHMDKEPESVEGKLVQDADLLFKFGVHDMWRMFHYASEKDEDIEEKIEYFKSNKIPKMKEELDKFHYDITRKIAEKRMERLQETMAIFETHLRGDDITKF